MIFDELTSAYTADGFYTAAQKFLFRKERQGIIVIDLDGFKKVNHVNGREIGDALLRVFVRDIYKLIPRALVGRLGDDEFAVFISEVQDERQLKKYASDIVEQSRKVRHISGVSVFCTVTVGAMLADSRRHKDKTFYDLIGLTEFALSDGKRAGGNRYEIYTDATIEKYKRTDDIKYKLQEIIEADSAFYKYQPIYDIRKRKVGGFEMLARMSGDSDISPAEFIHIARESNMIHYFDISALNTACGALNKLEQAGFGDVYISVNVSPEFFLSDDFFNTIMDTAIKAGINLSSLVIELTEDTFISSYERAKMIIEKLGDIGIRFYVDDFGTGYSNLSRLQELKMSALKIDKSIVDKMESDNSLVRKTIEIARIFNMKVVAEGIETRDQFEHLRSIGCDMIQGYLIGKPMPYDEMEKFLKESRGL